ncbi:hypothetical protein CKA32_001067 [Geitlerinema sp. FC II]|nr:hypothetical protein CKA32_001067 [Geitlerinema sp. FC II]
MSFTVLNVFLSRSLCNDLNGQRCDRNSFFSEESRYPVRLDRFLETFFITISIEEVAIFFINL